MPHEPQSLSVVSDVSQPFFGSPSQSPQPAAQVGAHTPELHVVDPCRFVQVMLQPPQFVDDVLVLVSQPGDAVQSAKPGLQAMEQAPLLQEGVPFTELQTAPQALQLLTSVLRFFSQPLE